MKKWGHRRTHNKIFETLLAGLNRTIKFLLVILKRRGGGGHVGNEQSLSIHYQNFKHNVLLIFFTQFWLKK